MPRHDAPEHWVFSPPHPNAKVALERTTPLTLVSSVNNFAVGRSVRSSTFFYQTPFPHHFPTTFPWDFRDHKTSARMMMLSPYRVSWQDKMTRDRQPALKETRKDHRVTSASEEEMERFGKTWVDPKGGATCRDRAQNVAFKEQQFRYKVRKLRLSFSPGESPSRLRRS